MKPTVLNQVPRARWRTWPRATLSLCCLLLSALWLTETARAAEEFHNTVVILLDASGSMNGPIKGSRDNRMTAAKNALKAVLEKVPASTRIGLLVFSASNLKDDWAYPLGPRDDARLFQAIDSIKPGHDTPLGRYLKKAADRLLEERAKEFGYGTYRLLVVTDGEAQDQELVEKFTPEIVARGLTVDVVGVAMDKNHTLAKKVHSYRAANDPEALNRSLAEVLGEVRGTERDSAGAEAFALIAPIPDKVAASMIQSLANAPNHPIGDRARVAPAAAAPAPVPAVAATSRNPAPTPAPQPVSAPRQERRGKLNWGLLVVIFIAFMILRSLIKAVRKGSR